MQESPQVQAIRARYVASFPEKAKMISDCMGLIKRNGESESDLQEVKQELHKLAGSSGMYGYQDICDVARAGMTSIDVHDVERLKKELDKLLDLLQANA